MRYHVRHIICRSLATEQNHSNSISMKTKVDVIPTLKCFIEEDAISVAEVTFATPEGKVYQIPKSGLQRE